MSDRTSRSAFVLLSALSLALAAFLVIRFAGSPRLDRTLELGEDIALELEFDDPLAVYVELETGDGQYEPFGFATLGTVNGSLTLQLPPGKAKTVRLTMGVGGVLRSAADQRVVSRSEGPGLACARHAHPLEISDASASAQVQTEPGTRLRVSLTDGELRTQPERY